jgi:hypothetical protein
VSRATGKRYREVHYLAGILNDNYSSVHEMMKELNCKYLLYYYHNYQKAGNDGVFIFENWEKTLKDILNDKKLDPPQNPINIPEIFSILFDVFFFFFLFLRFMFFYSDHLWSFRFNDIYYIYN